MFLVSVTFGLTLIFFFIKSISFKFCHFYFCKSLESLFISKEPDSHWHDIVFEKSEIINIL